MPTRGRYEPSTRTIDDRDAECDVFKPTLRRGEYRGSSGVTIPRDEFLSVRAEVIAPPKPWYISIIPLALFSGLCLAVVVPNISPWYLAALFALFPLYGIFILAGTIYGLAWLTSGVPTLKYAFPGPLSRAWLARMRCAACGCPLRQFEPESDGRTECPLCKHAWRLAGEKPSTVVNAGAVPTEFPEPASVLLDARGERREPYLPSAGSRLLSKAARAALPAAEFRAVHDDALRRTGFSRGKLLMVLGVFSLFVLAVVAGFAIKNPVGLFIAIPAAAMLLGRAWGSLWRFPHGHARAVRDALLAYHRCPSCAARLGRAIGDGTQECPRCQAVWRSGPATSPAPAINPSPL